MSNLDSKINSRLNTINLVEMNEGKFLLDNPVPDWLLSFDANLEANVPFELTKVFLFFETYLDEVRQGLAKEPGTIFNSGPWSEPDLHGIERHLFASAFLIDGKLALQIRLIAESRRYHQQVFQKAREYSMAYERLVKEKEHREVLVHMIVHDLAGPLTSIYGALDLLSINPERTDLINIALKQANTQKEMIQSILGAYSAELTDFDPESINHDNAPRLRSLLLDQVEIFKAAFEAQGSSLELIDAVTSETDLPVIAEIDYLERLVSNLLENALRFSPDGTTTRIQLRKDDNHYVISICDQGQGVPTELIPNLFQPFQGGQQFGGKQGLGLYFCRIAVERWGQSIWCESSNPNSDSENTSGTCMSFTLAPKEPT